jgi:preprotein translocase subunit SecD
MKKGLRWKILLTLAITAGAIVISYPVTKKIKLGLDLKGGMHLLMQVLTDDAVTMETDQEILRLQELFKKNNLTFTSMTKEAPGRFTIQGTVADQEGKIRDQLDQYLRD